MVTLSSLKDVDFLFALVCLAYGAIVALLPAAATLVTFCSPSAAFAMASAAAVRWAARLRPATPAE